MNTSNIKKYAPKARIDFMAAVAKRLNQFGIYAPKSNNAEEPAIISDVRIEGSVMQIDGNSFNANLATLRQKLVKRVATEGFNQLVEHTAYTWFNRFCAIRYMELHDYLDHGLRVLSSSQEEGGSPEILEHAQDVAEQLGLNRNHIIELKLAGNKDEQLYRELLLGQCHKLHQAMPFLFEAIDDETELLLPDNLTRTDSILRSLVNEIPAEDWEQVEIIGWLYQFYISEKKDEVIGKVVKSEDIPAATQLFTPNWIVKYLVQNSVGRQWLQTYPHSSIKTGMDYYIEPAQQTDEVNAQIKAFTPDSIEPESIKVLDPACGSGHILVEAYQVLKAIYEERGYRSRDIPQLILENNLFGIDIDDRAAQLSGFALMMLARADDRHIFTRNVQLNVMAMQSTAGLSLQSEECLLIQDEQQRQEFVQKIQDLLVLFEQAKTFGSLITVPEPIADYLPTAQKFAKELEGSGDVFAQNAALTLKPIIKQTEILARKYDAVVANPPYMGNKGLNSILKKYLKMNFVGFEKDLFSSFVKRCALFGKESANISLMTPNVWMFLNTYESVRSYLINNKSLNSLIELPLTGFKGATVQICCFSFANYFHGNNIGGYVRLVDEKGSDFEMASATRDALTNPNSNIFFKANQLSFTSIPGSPISYWINDSTRDIFSSAKNINDFVRIREGINTGDNDKFLRLWWEVSIKNIGFHHEQGDSFKAKWATHNKGGAFRRWYGNQVFIMNWGADGKDIHQYHGLPLNYNGAPVRGKAGFFKESLSWSRISSGKFSIRYFEEGFTYDSTGPSIFASEDNKYYLLGLLNSKVISYFLSIMSPTVDYRITSLGRLPVLNNALSEKVSGYVYELVKIFKYDWNLQEESWDFNADKLIQISICGKDTEVLRLIYEQKLKDFFELVSQAKAFEENVNEYFINEYDFSEEMSTSVLIEDISLNMNPYFRFKSSKFNLKERKKFQSQSLGELISYAIGCMMGRYSLDQDGLVYANSGNEGFDPSCYTTFPADDDGIIPLTDQEWFADDATHRFREFVRVVWGEENLQQNLDFVAESLCLHGIKPKSSESSVETIRRYLSTQFYKSHLKTYKKRPIYWLFSSGKQKAFECLVYLHRYNESTLARMRTEYVSPLLGKYEAQADTLNQQIEQASSTAESNRLSKTRTALEKKQTELREFDDKLKHHADMQIKLDLDDGVKVNYSKFGDLLVDVKGVTGKK